MKHPRRKSKPSRKPKRGYLGKRSIKAVAAPVKRKRVRRLRRNKRVVARRSAPRKAKRSVRTVTSRVKTVVMANRRKRRSRPKKASVNYAGFRNGSGTTVFRVAGSSLKRVGTFKRPALRRFCQKHGIKVR